MRVVGYVRDAQGPNDFEPAFAQAEKIRRWVSASGHQLVSICQDLRTPGHRLGRDGFRALVGIIEAGQTDAVVVPGLETLSPDKVTQEVMLWDLRARGVTVLSTEEDEADILGDTSPEDIRMVVRDVLAKAANHLELLAATDNDAQPMIRADETVELPEATDDLIDDAEDTDVVIELILPDENDDVGRPGVRPVG